MQTKPKMTKLERALLQEKRHYKMFKVGKVWTALGISLLFGAGFALSQPSTAVSAATETAPAASTLATIQSQTVASLTGNLPTVTLAGGWTAPTWTAKDFNIVAVAGKSNTYTATLSTQGLAALQAANAGAKISAQNVQAGTLTIEDKTAETVVAKTPVAVSGASSAAPQKSSASAVTASAAASNQTVTVAATSDASATQDKAGSQAATASTSAAADAPSAAVTALGGDATQADIDQAKAASQTALKTTGQPQVITAMSPESTGTATITSSTDKIGYGSGVSGSFTLTVTMTGVAAGDKVTFTLPTTPTKQYVNGIFPLKSVQDFRSPDVGTVDKVTNADGTITITDTI